MTDIEQERLVFERAASHATTYLAGIRSRVVAPADEAVTRLRSFATEAPEEPMDPVDVIDLLDAVGSPATVANAGGRYFGFVNGGALPAARAAAVLAAAWDQNAAMRVMSPVAAALEDVTIGWMIALLGLPAGSGCGFVTGATVANVTCLAAARHALLARHGWDVEAAGLFGAPPITVVLGDEAHVSVRKALAILGLGRDRVVVVPADGQGRLDARQLPALDRSTIVCLQAGNVNTGAFDPFGDVCAAARASGAWVHVDGAFGLWALASRAYDTLTRGAADADSWATDAHKWLNVPYDCGLAFVRDADALRSAMSMQAAYLTAGHAREPMHWTPDASRRARGVEVWAALRSLGRRGLIDLMDRTCRHARRFAGALRAAGHEVRNDVVLNQVLVSFGDDATTTRVIEGVQRDRTCWCGATIWKGRAAMRISVSSWATTDEDVDLSVAAILRIAEGAMLERGAGL